jgi:hypothetical protein
VTTTNSPEAQQRFKEGQLVYLDDPGSPYDDWNGASCTVVNPGAGSDGRYVEVRLVIPRKGNNQVSSALFHPETVKPENRPWLRKNLREFVAMRDDLLQSAERIQDRYGDA